MESGAFEAPFFLAKLAPNESTIRRIYITMLRQCRKYAPHLVAAGAACTICGEFVAAMEPASQVNLYIAADTGADQPHDHREPRAPIQMSVTVQVSGTLSAADSSSLSWLSGEIPSSIATSTAWDFSPIGERFLTPLRWQAPTYPAPGHDYVEWPALLTARSS